MTQKMIGLLGGTFDPIHCGHLHIALACLKQLPLDALQFIPCHIPPHQKVPNASTRERLAMVKLAIEPYSQLSVNPIELNNTGPCYTINTLTQLNNSNDCLCFILGSDSFLQFEQWQEWQSILNYCHLVIINRPSYPLTQLNSSLRKYYQQNLTSKVADLTSKASGHIYILPTAPNTISSSYIRMALRNKSLNNGDIPEKVRHYIEEHKLYQGI